MSIKNALFTVAFSLIFSLYGFSQDNTFIESNKDTMAFVQIIQDPDINTLNNFYIKSQKNEETFKGYMIQIYYGKREEAFGRKEEFSTEYPDIHCEVTYEAPYFKTLAGKYLTKLDADRELETIRLKFKNAFIIRKDIKL